MKKLKELLIDFWYYCNPVNRLRKSGATVGKNVFIGKHTYVELENAQLLTIEDNVTIAAHTKIILHDSSLNNVTGSPVLFGKVILKHNCYIGANVTILPGTVVGESTIVGANSLVKGELKKNSLFVGQPARYVSSLKELQTKWRSKDNPLIFFKHQKRWNKL